MRDLTTWLLVVNTLIAMAMVAYHSGDRPLVPMRISLQPAHAVRTWSPRRQAQPSA